MRLRALGLALLLVPLCGCFVFDELDKSEQMIGKQPEAVPQPAGAAPGEAKPPNWWEKASTLAPGEGDASIVGCRLGGQLQFMREADCLTRGGRPRRG